MTKNKKEVLVPTLRFKEFGGEWIKDKVGSIGNFKGGGTPSTDKSEYWEGDIPWVSSSDVSEGEVSNPNITRFLTNKAIAESATKIIPKDSVLFVSRVGVGKLAVSKEELCTSQDFANLILEKDSSYFIAYYFIARNKLLHRYSQGTSIKGFTTGDLKSIPINLPSLSEQQKIASFLSAVDEKIHQLTKKKELLEQYKKGVMQQLFSQKLRFKDKNGNEFPDWEERKLSHYLTVSKNKNEALKYDKNDVLSVSGEFGIVNQIEFQGRSFAGASVHNYGLVESGDIVYTKSPLKTNPYGIIKVNKNKPGIVSTLYAVYKCKPTVIGAYLDYYFQLDDNTNRYLRPLVQKGSKNDMKINNEKVLIDPIMIPSTIEEQQKVVDYLEELDSKIALANNQITQTQTYKRGLLQKMFV